MSDEDQTDIIEEHIPKVSDNIFLVHEKHHHRHVKVPQSKKHEVKHDPIPTTPKSTVTEVNNVVIIEKEKAYGSEVSKQSGDESKLSKDESPKEYPVAGIVHRLMDRFQRSGSSSAMRTTTFQAPPYQRSKSADVLDQQGSETKRDSPASPVNSPDMARTHSTASEHMAPLLIGTAKPFSRHSTTNSRDHGYHHVNLPFCKVTPPKHQTVKEAKTKPRIESTISSPTAVDTFSSDLSNLHSNQDGVLTKHEHEKQKAPMNHSRKIHEPPSQRSNLVNGDSLHSSGNASPVKETVTISKPETKNKANSRSGTEEAETVKTLPTRSLAEENRDASSRVPEKPKTPNAAEKLSQESKKMKRSTKEENEFRKVVHESLDESTLKTPAAIAANRIMKSSKTYKITPKKQMQHDKTRSNIKQDAVVTKVQVKPSQSQYDPKPTPSVSMTLKVEETQKAKSVSLPSTVIDDIIKEPASPAKPKAAIVITPVVSLPISEARNTKQTNPETDKKEKFPQRSQTIETSTRKVQSQASSNEIIKPSQKVIEPSSKSPTFARNFINSSPRKGGGRSFVIDPSKFKKSPAVQQSTVNAGTPTNVLKDSGNRRVIVPQSRQGNNPIEMEDEGTQKMGKRKLTADQIQVIGGYISLERSCLMKENKRTKQGASIKFSEKDLETTYTYVSERSMLDAEPHPNTHSLSAAPSFAKDGAIGKYTPKYLLSMKGGVIPDEEEDITATKSSTANGEDDLRVNSTDATPLSDESATPWSGTTSQSTDILF